MREGLSDEVVACLVDSVSIALFSPPRGYGATLHIPVTFVTAAAAEP